MPTPQSSGRSNNRASSTQRIPLKPVKFKDLLAFYPEGHPCDEYFKDQCSIKVSVALQGAGISMKTYTSSGRQKCWFHKDIIHALRAEELAGWLNLRYVAGIPKAQDITGEDWEEKVDGKTGIIFFKDYWRRENEKTPSGDHIDLWNKDILGSKGLAGWLRYVGINSVNINIDFLDIHWTLSDLRQSKKILFWEIP